MRYLLPGSESENRIGLLISLTKIESEPVIKAINARFSQGFDLSMAATIGKVDESNFSDTCEDIEQVAKKVERIKELDWGKAVKHTIERVELLLSFTQITCEKSIAAIQEHLVQGEKLKHAASNHSVDYSNLHKRFKRVKAVGEIIEQIKIVDWGK